MLNYGKAPPEPTTDQKWAISKIQEYQYRELFKLSEQDFLSESFESVSVNMKIREIIDRKENREIKRAKRKAKR